VEQPANSGIGSRRRAGVVRVPATQRCGRQRERRGGEGVVPEKRRGCVVDGLRTAALDGCSFERLNHTVIQHQRSTKRMHTTGNGNVSQLQHNCLIAPTLTGLLCAGSRLCFPFALFHAVSQWLHVVTVTARGIISNMYTAHWARPSGRKCGPQLRLMSCFLCRSPASSVPLPHIL
jgi:hypothetical protein